MNRLSVWVAEQSDDHACYNLIARTRKELAEKLKAHHDPSRYERIVHVEIEYEDAFDLFDLVTSEGGGRNGSYRVLSITEVKQPKGD